MTPLLRLGLAGCLAALLVAVPLRGAAASGAHRTCSGTLTIFTTSVGTVTTHGSVTFYRDSGVGGSYASGPLAGYTFSGAQDIVVNTATAQSELQARIRRPDPAAVSLSATQGMPISPRERPRDTSRPTTGPVHWMTSVGKVRSAPSS
jgi:hypothetical protein